MRIHRKSGKHDDRRSASSNDWNANNGREKQPRSTGSRHDGGRTPRLRKSKERGRVDHPESGRKSAIRGGSIRCYTSITG